MICVSIGRGRHRHMVAEHKHLVEQGARLVELRLDYINGEINIKRLIADRPCPVVITCRRPADGGKYQGPEEERLLLLRTAIAEGVEYVDMEEDIAGKIPRFGKTKRIISHHNFRRTPENLPEIHRRLCALEPDIVKISTMANHPRDNLLLLQLSRQSKTPTISLGMGDIGVPSRILAGKFGAPFTYATFSHERALAPGQLSYQQMIETYHYDDIRADTDVFGVIADPVGHSLSPLIHNAGFRHFAMNKIYVPFRVPREDLSRFLDDAPALGVRGLSVTIPHKSEVIKKLTETDDAVRGIGAVNTMIFNDGKRLGYNTDYNAAMSCLDEALRTGQLQHEKESNLLRGKTALVLGAGGVGKAVVYGLYRRGANIVLSDINPKAAAALANAFRCRVIDWGGRHTVMTDLLFNCTPVGMHPNVDETPYDKHHLRPSMTVFDVVYNPESTLLVKDARSRNCAVITGVEMFVRQACMQFKLFTGQDGPADLMRDTIRRAIGAAKY
jgi:3-dehydroquinate dehydratase / shikimate dehydrogenase